MPDYRLGIRVETRDEASRGLEQITRKFEDVGDGAERLSKRGADAMSDLERATRDLGRGGALDQVNREFDKVGRAAEGMADDGRQAFGELERAGDGVDFAGVRQEIDKTGSAFDDMVEGFQGKLDIGSLIGAGAIGGLAGGLVAGVGGAVAGAFGGAIESAQNTETAVARVRTQLSLTAEEAEKFRPIAEELFRDVFGESVAENVQTLATIEQIFRRIGGTENEQQLQRVAEHALSIADAFGAEVPESVNAAVTIMDKFGVDADTAFGFIVAGFQRGLNSSDDFLDTIGEYSGQFGDMGASAEEFFSVLETGFEGGVLGTDKVADAFKEFNIRIMDDSKTTRDALAGIGISYDELTAGFASGAIDQIDAVQDVIAKLNEVEDPIARNIAGVALFGTQWEDTTADVILNVDTQKTKVGELDGSVGDLGDQYDTTTVQVEAAFRKWDLALVPFADSWNLLKANVVSGAAEMLTAWNGFVESYMDKWWIGQDELPPLPGSTPLPRERSAVDPLSSFPISPGGPTPPAGWSNVTMPRPNQAQLDALAQRELIMAQPVTAPPAGWVGAWNPSMGSGNAPNNFSVTQNFYGPADARDTKDGALEAARRMGIR